MLPEQQKRKKFVFVNRKLPNSVYLIFTRVYLIYSVEAVQLNNQSIATEKLLEEFISLKSN